jgi:hypothetical protein
MVAYTEKGDLKIASACKNKWAWVHAAGVSFLVVLTSIYSWKRPILLWVFWRSSWGSSGISCQGHLLLSRVSRCNVPCMADLGNRVHRLTSPPVPFRALYRTSDIVPRPLPNLRHHPAMTTAPPTPSRADHSTSGTVPRLLHSAATAVRRLQYRWFRHRHRRLRSASASGPPVRDKDLPSESTASVMADRRRVTGDQERNDGNEYM